MKAYFGIIVILNLIFCEGADGFTCSKHTTCQTCADAKSFWFGPSCRWCPLNRECHTYGSLFNPCSGNQYITEADKCYDLTPGVYNPNSAYTSTLLSAAAYSDTPKTCLDKIYPTNNIEIVELIGKRCEDLPLFAYKECFAYTAVSHATKIIILSFRGTNVTGQLINQLISVLTIPRQPFPSGGEVQNYFKNAYDGIFPCAAQSVGELFKKYPSYEVVVTGHSLGGAIASLAAVSLVYSNIIPKDKLTLYTLGSPRVGDKEYAINHDRLVNNSWRLVHYKDVVSQFPTCSLLLGCTRSKYTPYHHGIEIFYPEPAMNVRSAYKQCKKDEDIDCSRGLITKDYCINEIQACVNYHKFYFGVKVGHACLNTLRYEPANGLDASSELWDMFVSDACRRIDAKTFEIKK